MDKERDHCCLAMIKDIENKFCPIYYSSKWREYLVELRQSTGGIKMTFCFNCGKKLPNALRNKWFDILQEEYGLEYPLEEDKKKVPKEFKTDEWWKKRGL